MIEFAAGILVGGSVGAVIMGALLAQVRTAAPGVRQAAALQAHAAMQPLHHFAARSARQTRIGAPLPVLLRTGQFAVVSPQLH
jgi:hypothetical protein